VSVWKLCWHGITYLFFNLKKAFVIQTMQHSFSNSKVMGLNSSDWMN